MVMTAKDNDGDFGVHGSHGGDDFSPFRIRLDINRHVPDCVRACVHAEQSQ